MSRRTSAPPRYRAATDLGPPAAGRRSCAREQPAPSSGRLSTFAAELRRRLADLEARGLRRQVTLLDSPPAAWLVTGGRRRLNFSSNDYLGLAGHPALREAARRAVDTFGAGATASRLICGTLPPHRELEAALARFKGVAAALSFATGYATALGTVPALVGPGDVVVLDKLAHACLVDAARLSGARLRIFPHNDPAGLEARLAWAQARVQAASPPGRVLVVTESVFSMDGDLAALRELVELKDRFGAWLMVDEAHATGVFGEAGRGVIAAAGLTGRVEVQMGTLGKALGAAGGFVAGEPELVDWLVNRARAFIYSTAPPPAAAAAATAGVELAAGAEGEARRAALWARVRELRAGLTAQGWALPAEASPIVPLVVGEERAALELSARLREAGFFLPAIRYPTVPRGAARLRVSLSASHTAGDVARLLEALGRWARPPQTDGRNPKPET